MIYKKFLIICSIFLFTVAGMAQNFTSGKKLLAAEKYPEALAYFKTLLNGDTKDEANFYIGQVYFQQGKLDSAKYFYNEGFKADPDDALNVAGLVKVAVAENNSAEADKKQAEALDIDDENAEVYTTLAEAYSAGKNNNADKAIELLNKAIKLKPKNADTYLTLGKVYMSRSNGTEAIKNFQQAISLDPGNADAMTQKAKVYILINNFTDAVSLLEEATKADPEYAPAFLELAELNYNLKDFAKASDYYAKYIAKTGADIDKQKRFAQILYMNKEYEKAVSELKNVVAADPENATAYRILAYSYRKLDDSVNSMASFEKLFSAKNAEPQVVDYETYVELLTKAGHDSLAIEYLYKIVQMDSSRQDVYAKMMPLYYKARNWNGIITALNKELFDLGKAYQFAKDSIMADTTFGRLIAAKPDISLGYLWRARIKSSMDPESTAGLAKPYYEKVVEIDSADPVKYKNDLIEAYSYLGYYSLIKDKFRESYDYYTKLLSLEPANETALKVIAELKKKI
jgi:tetratricopeptide (TPR) repeat protein